MSDTTRSRAILATASRLFAGKGYSQTTTAEIAREAGVAEGTLYHHFGSKDGIFLTLFDETMEGYLAGVDALLARETTGKATLSAFVRFHFGYVSLRKEQYLILLRDFPVHLSVEHFGGRDRHDDVETPGVDNAQHRIGRRRLDDLARMMEAYWLKALAP